MDNYNFLLGKGTMKAQTNAIMIIGQYLEKPSKKDKPIDTHKIPNTTLPRYEVRFVTDCG